MTIDPISIIGFVVQVMLLIILIVGMVICKKRAFMEGFFFFLIMFVYNAHSLYAPLYMRRIYEYYDSNPAPSGLSLGEIMGWLSYIHPFLLLIAVSILALGIYKRWNRTKSS